jgi:hypothetical protein
VIWLTSKYLIIAYGCSISSKATLLQKKTGSPVRFEIIKGTKEAVAALIKLGYLNSKEFFVSVSDRN